MLKRKASTGWLGQALSLFVVTVFVTSLPGGSFAQTGGSAGGGGGSTGSSAGGTGSGSTGTMGAAPGGGISPSAGGLSGRSTGGGVTAVPTPFPTTPQAGLGSAQVPSAGNAEANSPVRQQQAPLGTQTSPTSPSTATTAPGGGAANDGASTGAGGSGSTDGTSSGSGETPEPVTGRVPGQPLPPESVNPTELSSGGTARTDNARQGAAGHTLESCMQVWEPATHMSKDEWRRTCERTLTEGPSLDR